MMMIALSIISPMPRISPAREITLMEISNKKKPKSVSRIPTGSDVLINSGSRQSLKKKNMTIAANPSPYNREVRRFSIEASNMED